MSELLAWLYNNILLNFFFMGSHTIQNLCPEVSFNLYASITK